MLLWLWEIGRLGNPVSPPWVQHWFLLTLACRSLPSPWASICPSFLQFPPQLWRFATFLFFKLEKTKAVMCTPFTPTMIPIFTRRHAFLLTRTTTVKCLLWLKVKGWRQRERWWRHPWWILNIRYSYILPFNFEFPSAVVSGSRTAPGRHESGWLFLYWLGVWSVKWVYGSFFDVNHNYLIISFPLRKRLMVRDKTGNMLFLLIPDLPEYLRRPLLYHLELVYKDSLKPTNSRQEDGFGALHFTFYNRYSSQVGVWAFRFVLSSLFF